MEMVIYLDEIFSIRYDLNGNLFINKAFLIEDFDLITFLLDHGCEVGSDIVQSFQKQETPFMKFLKKNQINLSTSQSKSIASSSIEQIKNIIKSKSTNFRIMNKIQQYSDTEIITSILLLALEDNILCIKLVLLFQYFDI